MTPPLHPQPDLRHALARSIGLAAFVYGYPLVETYRTCRLQTAGPDPRSQINVLRHSRRPCTHEDRDVVTPANDLLYSLAWIHLAYGPCLLTVPSDRAHAGRYFVLALYDAYTENFENLGPRNCAPEGETVVMVGPGRTVPDHLAGHRLVRCPSDLVWLIGRIVVGDAPDWPAAHALQADIGLAPAAGTTGGELPPAVANWVGSPVDAMAEVFEGSEPADAVAPRFFANLCHALAEAPGRPEDSGLLAWFGQAEIVPDAGLRWEHLPQPVREGLTEGFAEGVRALGQLGLQRQPQPWRMTRATGRYGSEYLGRARTAYLGLGALATDEALYASAHHDADLHPLEGCQHYTLCFAAGDLPPADAFWSVTLYDADRFLYGNEIARHAIGDRTPGLQREADGSLRIDLGPTRPGRGTANWLPTPAGRFYLILRMYHPQAHADIWTIPALQPAGQREIPA